MYVTTVQLQLVQNIVKKDFRVYNIHILVYKKRKFLYFYSFLSSLIFYVNSKNKTLFVNVTNK